MVIMWHINIFLFPMAISISTYSIQFIFDIELIKINIIGSSGRAFQLNHNVLKLILEDYCISFQIYTIDFFNFSTVVKIIRIMRDGFGKMHCKKLIIFVGSSPSQGDIFFLKSDTKWALLYILNSYNKAKRSGQPQNL